MSEQNKYYTPIIEEFHVGFEYEYLYKNSYWVEHTINTVIDLTLCIEENSEGLIRVKYLDKTDIESLGFEENSWSEEGQWLFNKDRFILTVVSSNNRVMITDRNRSTSSTDGKYYHYMLFDGTIKNKSELKVLLKQLGIDV